MMAKVYILTDKDFDDLNQALARDPKRGTRGHTSQVLSAVEEEAHNRAQRFYNYHVVNWIEQMKK